MNPSATRTGEYANVGILFGSQALFMIAAVTVMTLSGVVGQTLAPDPALATLPVAIMMVGTVLSTLPASLFMKRVGRRLGFLSGTLLGGAGGGLISVLAIAAGQFWLFCVGSFLFGLYQGFAMYYRFAAADVASESFRSKAISLVMAGGVVAAFFGPWNARYSTAVLVDLPNAGPYAVIVALSLLSALLLSQLRVPQSAEPAAAAPARRLGQIAAQPLFRVAVLVAAVGYAVMILVMTATPLAMRMAGFTMADAAFVMQWHVLGMFVPSFFTGALIARFGVLNIILAGAAILVGAVVAALSGQALAQFWLALVLLGIGWNFLFIGGSTLLTRSHSPAERGLVQGTNDLAVFSLVAVGSLLAGVLLHYLGWAGLNLSVLPFVLLAALAVGWLKLRTRETAGAAEGAQA